MPLALLLLGVLFLVAAVRGKQDILFATMKSDFTGPKNFFYWGIALFLIGAVGYYKPMKPFSSAFLTLVIIVLFFSNRGFPQEFMDQIGATSNVDTGTFHFGDSLIGEIAKLSTEFGAMGVKF
jgi:hypothetical protein